MPTAVLADSDRTIVTEQPDNTDYKVGVYKIDLDKPHKIKVGISYIDNKHYYSVGYQQNKVEVLAHIRQQQLAGASVMYTIKTW